VTNDTTTAVVVLDAYQSATNAATGTPGQGYQQALKTLSLAGGGSVLAAAATGTVTLDDTRTNAQGQTQPNYVYQLLISDAASLFPVMNTSVQVAFETMSYPPVTVTAAAQQNMALALQFVQSIKAYPGSNLAKGFQQAMTTAQAQPTATAMMASIAAWFGTTKQFQALDYPSYLAVTTFIDSFAWVWGLADDGVTPDREYWIYSAAGAGQQPATGSSSSQAPNLGSIQFAHSGQSPADPTDRNSGYTITYTPASGTAQTLTFADGQFVDDPDSDTPAVCLQGSYALKSQFTNNPSDNVLWPVLYGTVNGTQVIAVSQGPESWWQQNISDKTFSDWCALGLKILGAAMALEWLYNKLSGRANNAENARVNDNRGAELNQQQEEAAVEAGNEAGGGQLQRVQEEAARMGNEANVPVDENSLEQSVNDINDQAAQVARENAGDLEEAALQEESQQIEELSEIEVNDQIEDSMSDLIEARDDLAAAESTGDFSAVQNDLDNIGQSLEEDAQDLNLSGAAEAEFADAQHAINEYSEAAEQESKDADASESGDEDDLLDDAEDVTE
jgi:hypothetical protein